MDNPPEKPPEKSKKRGGKRPGAGRKISAVTQLRDSLIASTEQLICASLPGYVANLQKLAFGGFERVEETWEPAPQARGSKAKPRLVLVSRKVSYAEPDRAANQYLIDRILGKPKQNIDLGPEGERRDGTLDALREIAERGRKAK